MASRVYPTLAVFLLLAIQPANGQSFLDSLFGSDGPVPSRPASGYVRSQPAPSSFDDVFVPSINDIQQPYERFGTYRTLCVRMCDGFYFPISSATSSSSFAIDAEKCSASCGSEARLFYYPNQGGDIEGMLDMTGRTYASYPTAFKYRKTLVQGCQCRPAPWTETELARHRAYAAAQISGGQAANGDAANRNGFTDFGPRVPSSSSAFNPAPEETPMLIRPAPVYRQWGWSFEPTVPRRSPYSWPGTR